MSEYFIENYNYRSVIITKHAILRNIQRSSQGELAWKEWFKRIIDYFDINKMLEENDKILIYSKKLGQGVVLDYRRDTQQGGLAFVIITILPPSHQRAHAGTDKYLIEKYNQSSFKDGDTDEDFSIDFVNYLTTIIKDVKEISGKDKSLNETRIFESKVSDTDIPITIILIDGKYYDYYGLVLKEIN